MWLKDNYRTSAGASIDCKSNLTYKPEQVLGVKKEPAMNHVKIFMCVTLMVLVIPFKSFAGAVDGKWLFQKDNSDEYSRALNIGSSSFVSLIVTAQGAAYETGWWTESLSQSGRTRVIVRYGDQPAETIEYKMDTKDVGAIWLEGQSQRWGTMSRMNCDLSMQFRNKSDAAPAGCAWLHIRGWGYSGLEGECVYSEDWANLPEDPSVPMECLIEAPSKFVN
jgi:hypothetical protein